MKDLFLSSVHNIERDKGSVRLEQETSGLRTTFYKNFPLLYGSETIRITKQSTSSVRDMKNSTGGEGTDGLIGGQIDSATKFIKSKLGIPTTLIPTRIKDKVDGFRSDKPVTVESVGGDGGTVLGNFLAQAGGGTPKQIGTQAVGIAVGKAKDKARSILFGTRGTADGLETTARDGSIRTTDEKPYSELVIQQRMDILSMSVEDGALGFNPFSIGYNIDRKPSTELNEENIDYYENSAGYKVIGKDVKIRNIFEENNEYATEAVKVKIEVDGQEPLWFPLVVISGISETFTPNWPSSKMVGSPFSQFMYEGIERNVGFSLKMYSTNPDTHKKIWEKLDKLAKLVYPLKYNGAAGVVTPPITKLTIGGMYKEKYGFISSLSYTMVDEGGWDTGFDDTIHSQLQDSPKLKSAGKDWILPKIIDVSISYTFIENRQDVEEQLYSFEPVN